jgi:hypothetical protein
MSPTRQLPGSYPGAAPSESGPGARFELFELPFSDKNWRESVAALAAIQGLNEKVEEQKAELKRRDAGIAALEERLARLEGLLSSAAYKP